MGCWYSFSGTVKIRLTEESRPLIDELKKAVDGLKLTCDVEEEGEVATIEVSGGGSMSYSSATNIDACLEALGSFTVEAACFEGECQSEPSVVYVGSDEQIAVLRSTRAKGEILRAMRYLLPDDRATVLAELQKLLCPKCGKPLTDLGEKITPPLVCDSDTGCGQMFMREEVK